MAGPYREKDIAYEAPGGAYWVLRVSRGFEVYKAGITHSTRCAVIGWLGEKGLDRAKAEIARRVAIGK